MMVIQNQKYMKPSKRFYRKYKDKFNTHGKSFSQWRVAEPNLVRKSRPFRVLLTLELLLKRIESIKWTCTLFPWRWHRKLLSFFRKEYGTIPEVWRGRINRIRHRLQQGVSLEAMVKLYGRPRNHVFGPTRPGVPNLDMFSFASKLDQIRQSGWVKVFKSPLETEWFW